MTSRNVKTKNARRSFLMISVALLGSVGLTACVSHDEAMSRPQIQSIGQYPSIVTAPFVTDNWNEQSLLNAEQALFQLTPEQIEGFQNWFEHPARSHLTPHKRLSEFLEEYTWGFDYRGESLTATEAMQQKAGNCLSLAMMTGALARLVGVETGYQKVNARPIFKKQSNILTLSHHVRTYLYDPTWVPAKNDFTFVRPRLVVDYFPNRYDVRGEAVSETQFLGMYYRNLAADALLSGNIKKAFWLARKALSLAANDAENINLIAVIYGRANLPKNAEAFYLYGVNNARNNTNLLSNYSLFLERQGREQEAARIRQKLLDLPDNNPYSWMKLGHEAYLEDKNKLAIHYYKKALELAPYLDEAYFGLAKSLYRDGNFSEASKAMREAAEKSWEQSTRELYYAKLAAIRAREPD